MSGKDNPFKAPMVKLVINSLPVEYALNFVLAKIPMDSELKEQFLSSLVKELNASGQSLGEFIFTEENIKAVETILALFTSIKEADAEMEDIITRPLEKLEQIEV